MADQDLSALLTIKQERDELARVTARQRGTIASLMRQIEGSHNRIAYYKAILDRQHNFEEFVAKALPDTIDGLRAAFLEQNQA